MRTKLKKAGFDQIGSGAFKSVFHNLQYPHWVVKVFNGRSKWYYDHSTVSILPTDLKSYWLGNIFQSRRFVIQHHVRPNKRAWKRIDREIGGDSYRRFDLYRGNCGYYKGNPVVMDYTDNLQSVPHPKYRWFVQ